MLNRIYFRNEVNSIMYQNTIVHTGTVHKSTLFPEHLNSHSIINKKPAIKVFKQEPSPDNRCVKKTIDLDYVLNCIFFIICKINSEIHISLIERCRNDLNPIDILRSF